MNEIVSRNVFCKAKQPVILFLRATIGASGAPTLVSASSEGISSIARASEGVYNITLTGKYKALYSVHAAFLEADVIGVSHISITDDSVSSSTFQIGCYDADGTPSVTDPDDGSVMLLTIWLQNY